METQVEKHVEDEIETGVYMGMTIKGVLKTAVMLVFVCHRAPDIQRPLQNMTASTGTLNPEPCWLAMLLLTDPSY